MPAVSVCMSACLRVCVCVPMSVSVYVLAPVLSALTVHRQLLEKRSMIRGANMKPVEFEAARRTRVADHVGNIIRTRAGQCRGRIRPRDHGAHRLTASPHNEPEIVWGLQPQRRVGMNPNHNPRTAHSMGCARIA